MTKHDQDLARRIESDHKNLHESLDNLDGVFDRNYEEGGFAVWKLDRLWQLRDFQNQLQKLFDLEEDGGYNEDLIRLAPHLASQVAHLGEDHRKIISDLYHILDVLKKVVDEHSPNIARVRERIEVLVEFIRGHESKENAVIQEAYYQDYGVGD